MNNIKENLLEKRDEAQAWHTATAQETLTEFSSDKSIGLSDKDVFTRLETYGPNELPSADHVSPWSILFDQFKNVLIIILLVATAISASLGQIIESIAITVIVLFAIILGFIQEYRAERAIEALRKMAAPTATVIRNGIESIIAASKLVPGDLILIRMGDRAPADARLIEAPNLKADESALTGESAPVEKQTDHIASEKIPVGDRNNMIYSGTVITYGRGKAVVVATGMQTEFGKITGMLQAVERSRTPLQKNLDRLGKVLAIAALAIVVVIVIIGLLRGEPLLQMFIFGVALAVAAVPEALPAVVTISLAIGVQRMARKNALIRRLPTVETLGCASVICSDKTGTLTKGEMTVQKLLVGDRIVEVTGSGYEPTGVFTIDENEIDIPDEVLELLRGATLVNDARLHQIEGRWEIKGDPTEAALVVAAAKAGLDKDELGKHFPRVDEIPFTSERKRMTTIHTTPSGAIAYSKGAPELIIASCSMRLTKNGEENLDDAKTDSIIQAAHDMAKDALRVIAIARKQGAAKSDAESDMVFLGLIGMIDPARPEAREAIETCEKAGIKAIMITGDHPVTAEAIARELGLIKTGNVVTGIEMDAMTDDDLEKRVENIEVYARVSPEHKLRVVTAWQKLGKIVAMTGDGVNDAPALKKADIGIAMGISGTDVTKEAGDMTLTDDNFASIVGAMEEGRGIFSNIKKYLMYLISANIGEIGLMAGATLAGMPLPLTAVQILYVNLATDGLPALALAVDPPENDLMTRPPRDSRTGIFSRSVVVLMLIGGAWSMMINLALFSWALDSGMEIKHAMALTFLELVVIQFCTAYNFRSDRHSFFKKPFANRWLNIAILWEFSLLMFIVYTPFFEKVFGTFALSFNEWLIIIGLALTITIPLELAKGIIRWRSHHARTARARMGRPSN